MMRVIADAAAISSALSLVAAARQRDALTAMIAGDDGIIVVASDLGITIEAKVDGNVIVPGAAALSAERFAALVAAFAADAIIEIKTEPNSVIIGGYRLPSADMPMANTLTDETGRIEIAGDDCIALLAVASAAHTERTRSYLCGVHLRSTEDQLVAVATNGTRLIHQSVAAERFSTARDLILPTRSAVAIARLVRHTKSDRVLLRRSKSMLAANGRGFSFTTRLIDATYPAFEALIPELTANTVTVDRVELLAALARLIAIASGEALLVALIWTEGGPLHAFLPRQPNDGADDITAETKGRGRLVLVPSQITAMLNEFSAQRVLLVSAADRLMITDRNKLGVVMTCWWPFRDEVAA